MDELVEEFLVETKDGLEELDHDLIELEQNPNDSEIINNIFRAMHTIKGTCGFLGLGRLEAVAHAGENILDRIRAGELDVAPEVISLVLESVDQIKYLVEYLEENEEEPEGKDTELVTKLNRCAEGKTASADDSSASPTTTEEAPESSQKNETAEKKVDISSHQDSDIARDSAELQKLFDETECLVGQDEASDASPKPQASDGDSDELQKLFDETESLVDIKANPEGAAPMPEKKEEKKKVPEKSPAAPAVKKAPATQSIRVGLDVLEQLMQQASELVLIRNQLLQILRRQQESEFTSALHQLNHITTEIQEGVMKTRMQPVGSAWSKLPRIVRDLANELGKKIELKMEGEETELDRQLLDMIKDPLTHMVRNSADHGLETPEHRVEVGKPEVGTINLKAYQGGGYIIIEISDDGNGIDAENIKKKAIEKGLVSENEAEALSDSQILQYIFAAGFSTAKQVTSVSGRGVGMDVVKNNIEKISGTIDLQSTLGKGSTFTIKIPLTLAIMPVLEVAVSGQEFAIPQINVMEVVKAGEKVGNVIEYINDRPLLRLREKLLPLINLAQALGLEENSNDSIFIVVCEIGGYNFGIIVDEVFDTEEIVVKPVAPILKNIDLYSGCTILGNGDVIMILDPNGLARTVGDINTSQSDMTVANAGNYSEDQIASFVVFRAGDSTPKVVPLELLSRLEEIDVTKIELSGGDPVVQYRGTWMKICAIEGNYEIPEEGLQEFLVFVSNDKIMGIAVEEVLDIVRCPMVKDLGGGREGFLGSLVIDEKTCDVIDSSYYLAKTFGESVMLSSTQANIKPGEKRVLLVDDSPFFRKFIPPELEDAGFKVNVCAGGDEALKLLDEMGSFDALVTDLNMPGMSGQELVEACKENPRFSSIPMVALSAQCGDEDILNGNKVKGFDAYVSKTNHQELVEAISQVIIEKEGVA